MYVFDMKYLCIYVYINVCMYVFVYPTLYIHSQCIGTALEWGLMDHTIGIFVFGIELCLCFLNTWSHKQRL